MAVETSTNETKLQQKKSSTKVFVIFSFTTFGIILLLNIFGILPWTIWGVIWRFWPALLIILLLQFFTRKYRNANLIATAFNFGILTALVFFSTALASDSFNLWLTKLHPSLSYLRGSFGIEESKRLSSEISIKNEDYGNVKTRDVKINIGAGRINIADSSSSDYFIAKSNYYESFGKPTLESTLDSGALNINFKTSQDFAALVQNAPDIKYGLTIGHPEIPTQIEIKTEAGILNATFENLNLNTLNLQASAGTANIVLGEKSLLNTKRIDIFVGAGTLKLTLPYNAFVKINYAVGIGNLKIDSAAPSSKTGSYTTPKFRITEDPLKIDIKLGAGTVDINTSGQD